MDMTTDRKALPFRVEKELEIDVCDLCGSFDMCEHDSDYEPIEIDLYDGLFDGICDCYCGCSIPTFGIDGPCVDCRREIPGDHGIPIGG